MAIDFSFLRLSPSFIEAKSLGDPIYSDKTLWRSNQIVFLPTEPYCQITNNADGIDFDSDYAVHIIDCRETVLADVTDYIGIDEQTDSNGVHQLAWEIAPLGIEFPGKLLFFRLTHTTGDDVYYSTPFILDSSQKRNSSRLDYKGYGRFYGIPYDRFPFYQSIRINRLFFDAPANHTDVNGYRQISRFNEVSSNARTYFKSAYKLKLISTFIADRLQVLLNHDIIYIDGVRITDKPVLEHGDRLGDTNLFHGNFTAGIDRGDTYTPTLQIIEPLTLVTFFPFGSYTLAGLPANITGSFNKNVTLATGTIKVYDSTDTLIQTYTQADLTVVGNAFTVDAVDYVTANGEYYIEMSAGLFTAGSETSDAATWSFQVTDGYYDPIYYDDQYYLT